MTHVYTYKLISNIIKKQKTKNKWVPSLENTYKIHIFYTTNKTTNKDIQYKNIK